ncbi:hypothetical protein SeLEV6574_g02455 [Synchytrium endobioticum]|uniref:DUF8032 domain-containing protein n=1 Tax=Synchytrium endobioticum TaxID=286115 RepID=A0A507D881_9FUNG|nr:hypothetical protein SeLEV6574_g02455 [Synchytrium endobioticum]
MADDPYRPQYLQISACAHVYALSVYDTRYSRHRQAVLALITSYQVNRTDKSPAANMQSMTADADRLLAFHHFASPNTSATSTRTSSATTIASDDDDEDDDEGNSPNRRAQITIVSYHSPTATNTKPNPNCSASATETSSITASMIRDQEHDASMHDIKSIVKHEDAVKPEPPHELAQESPISSRGSSVYYDVARDAWIRKDGDETVIVRQERFSADGPSAPSGGGADAEPGSSATSHGADDQPSRNAAGLASEESAPDNNTRSIVQLQGYFSVKTEHTNSHQIDNSIVINHSHKRSFDELHSEYTFLPNVINNPPPQSNRSSLSYGQLPPPYNSNYIYPQHLAASSSPFPYPNASRAPAPYDVAAPTTPSLAPGMLPYTPAARAANRAFLDLPVAVERDPETGIEYMSFRYTERGVRSVFRIRIDVDSVDMDSLSEEFRACNAVYPRANVSKHQYSGLRWEYESGANAIGFALAYLNREILEGRRGLLQRAVDSFRNRDPSQRSRRARRRERLAVEAARDLAIGGMGGIGWDNYNLLLASPKVKYEHPEYSQYHTGQDRIHHLSGTTASSNSNPPLAYSHNQYLPPLPPQQYSFGGAGGRFMYG